eukprot:TRINITY_DN3002_c0_g1_i2.p1 TRINITY_DN3002_c0_g1~~TRINITY_DN3002_c0_g1_i2.p1  ORF type:complete len:340 (+),score=105.81 TRINITY_DN3002_c0_g1_i2:98-1117(+)
MGTPSHEGFIDFIEKKKYNEKKKDQMKYYFASLCGSSLHYYANISDDKPKGTLQLKGGKVSPSSNPQGLLLEAKEGEYYIVAADEADEKDWTTHLNESVTKDPQDPPPKEKKKKDSFLFKAKKNVAGKAATSKAGKEQLKKVLPAEINKLTDDFSKLIELKAGGPEKAAESYDTLIKLMVKIKLQLDRETITQNDFKPVLLALREAFECLATLQNSKAASEEAVANAVKAIKGVDLQVTKVMGKHLTTKNMKKFNDFFLFLASPQFLKDCWLAADLQDGLCKDISTLLLKYSTWENTFENFLPIRRTLGGLLIEVLADDVTNTKVYRDERDYLKERGVV